MSGLSKQQILDANDRKLEPVEVPEWGGTVYVRTLTGTEKDAYLARHVKAVDGQQTFDRNGATEQLVAMALCDESGNRLFTDLEARKLGEKNANVLERLVEVATKLNKLGADGLEEAEKNSEATPGDSLSTG